MTSDPILPQPTLLPASARQAAQARPACSPARGGTPDPAPGPGAVPPTCPPRARQTPPAARSRSKRFRPDAANEWDRMPAEIQHMILEHASPFTKFINGLLLSAEMQALPEHERQQVWSEALAVDWAGDLRLLPPVSAGSDVLAEMRSSSMQARITGAGVASDGVLRRAAVRNRWTHQLQQVCADDLALCAAREGALWLLADLVDARRVVVPRMDMAQEAALHGRRAVVEFLHARLPPGKSWPANVMDCAAHSGDLGMLEFMHVSRGGQCSHMGMELAARAGHLHVVRWLCAHGARWCSPGTVFGAAVGGHVAVLAFLHERFPVAFEPATDLALGSISSVAVLRFLHARGLVAPPQHLPGIVGQTNGSCVRWLCETFRQTPTQELFEAATSSGAADLALWLMTQPGIRVSRDAVKYAALFFMLSVLEAVLARGGDWADMVAVEAARQHEPDLVEWLHVRHPRAVTQRVLDVAAASGRKETVEYLLDRVTHVRWDLAAAMTNARGGGVQRLLSRAVARVSALCSDE
ncbi:hypothetical protein HK105_208804 [Polyrhizophydium stewartii]|uniref:Ankyrin repeat protein n=1 Tax=Polyrhizophydium stewartii TaxID=2732419 RepID=A0ABR4MWT7_9FUNG